MVENDEKIVNAFAENLRKLSSRRGVTQFWLSKQAQTTEATISRYMTGNHTPNVIFASRIAQAFSVSLDWMCGLSSSQYPAGQGDEMDRMLIDAFRNASDRDQKLILCILKDYMKPEEYDRLEKVQKEENTKISQPAEPEQN